MQALSASLVSLHSLTGPITSNEKKSSKLSDKNPSVTYFLVLIYTFLCMGLGSGLIGPTVLKFSEQMNIPLSRVVYLLFTRSIGYLLGTLTGGVLIDHFYSWRHTILSFAMFLMSLATLIIPFIYNLAPMLIAHAMWSLTAGIVDNISQMSTLRHYEQVNVGPYLQALHGAFGIGAFLSPLIIAPFLKSSSPIDQWHYAYWIIGCLHIPNLIWISYYAIRKDICSKPINQINLENKEIATENAQLEPTAEHDNRKISNQNYVLLSFVTLFILLYVGVESAFGAYIHTYATLHLSFKKDIAAYLNSMFWASFTFGRFCGVALSIKCSPTQMLITDLLGSIASALILVILNNSSLALWIGTILFGLSFGPIYATAIAYTEQQISLTGRRISIISIGGSIGDATIPLFIGYMINPNLLGHVGFVFILFVATILSAIIYGLTLLYAKLRSKTNKNTIG